MNATPITLVVPSYGGGPNIERTIASVAGICDEIVIISTALWDVDKAHFKQIAHKVVDLPWNYVFLHGFGSMMNMGTGVSKNDWLMLLGVAETFAEPHMDVSRALRTANANAVFRCNHVNDPHHWKRVWNRTGGTHWAGIIHEELVNGRDAGLLFRMQDTDKVPRTDPFQQEAMRWLKVLTYNHLYVELLNHPERLGGANAEWLKFVRGAKEFTTGFCADHADMLTPCLSGDLNGFLNAAEKRFEHSAPEASVSFSPQGT